MPNITNIGTPSSTDIPVRCATINGSGFVTAGANNPNAVEWRVIGNMFAYHNITNFSGLPGGFAATSDHSHLFLQNLNAALTAPQLGWSQMIYTAIATETSMVIHGNGAPAIGTLFTNEHSIDTTGTVQFPTAPNYVGRIILRYTTNPGITAGENLLFQTIAVPVAGIQAAIYSGVAATSSTLVGGLWEVQVDLSGLDPAHWDWTDRTNTTLQNASWQLTRLVAAIPNATSIASVPSDTTAVDVTFSALPATVEVGRSVGLLLAATTTLTGLSPGILYPGYISAVTGLVARIRLRNSRFTTYLTMGGSDSTPSRFQILPGVRDPNHEPVPSHCAVTQRRNADGVVTVNMFGSVDSIPSVVRSVGVGRNLVLSLNDEWKAGTDNFSNVMSLRGNVLSTNGINVGSGTNVARIKHGRATLVGGTITVSDTSITANSRIFVTSNVDGGTPGWLRVSARVVGASFTITSSSGTDTSQVDYLIIEP